MKKLKMICCLILLLSLIFGCSRQNNYQCTANQGDFEEVF